MRYRVDNVPLLWRPLYLLVCWSLAISMYACVVLLHFCCRIRTVGWDRLKGRPNFIFCLWHDGFFPLLVSRPRYRKPHAWLGHAAWYMKPIYIVMRLVGIREVVLGSTGHSGQEGAARLVDHLKRGFSTMIFPDGPAGPPKVLKKGVLHMALQSGVPIVPMRIVTRRQIVLKSTWEGKRTPLPFSTVEVLYGEPIVVTEKNFEEAEERLVRALG